MTTHDNLRRTPAEGLSMTLRSDVGKAIIIAAAFSAFAAVPVPGYSQPNRNLDSFFRQDIGFSEDQIAAIRSGTAVSKAMPPRSPAEVFLVGAIYIHAAPESYIRMQHDYERLRKLPGYLGLNVFSHPPQTRDVQDLAFSNDEIESLKNCRPGECLVQMPEASMKQLQNAVDWTAPDAADRVNQMLRQSVLQLIQAYQRNGNQALGTYNDKPDKTEVAQQFEYMLSYSKALPARLPAFNNYLLNYPRATLGNVEDTFYWARVKFGLKPTVRVVHVTTVRGGPGDDLACAIAEKQLYSSHYFQTALDLSFCIRGTGESAPGFYLIMAMGSEQAGLTGLKGTIIRKAAVGRSVSDLRDALTTIRNTLEAEH